MTYSARKGTLIFFFLILPIFVIPQQKKIDSLLLLIKNHQKQDTIMLSALNELAYSYYAINPQKGIDTATKAIVLAKSISNTTKELATAYAYKGHNLSARGQDSLALLMYDTAIEIHKKRNDRKAIARLIYNKGLVYFNQSDYQRANDCNIEAYKVFEKEKDNFLMAKMLNSIGINYMYRSDYPKALESYLKASLIYENLKLTDDLQYVSIISNTGLLYARLNQLDLSLEYQQKALANFRRLDYQEGVANSLTNIGRIHNDLGDSEKAIDFYGQAFEIMKKNGNERGMASALTNIGIAYISLENHKKALPYFLRTKSIYEKLKNSNNLAIVYKNLGDCYLNLPAKDQNYKAEKSYRKSLKFAEKAGSLNLQFDALENIAIVNTKTGNFEQAYAHKVRAVVLRDSFNSVEKKEEIARLQVKHQYDKEKAILKVDYQQKQSLANAELQRERLVKNYIYAGIGVLVLATGIGYVLYKRKRDALEQKKRG